MTLEQAQALTDDEIRVRVAEIQGWKGPHMQYSGPYVGMVGDAPDGARSRPVPNYPADLNACADMERMLNRTETGWSEYADSLEAVTGTDGWEIMSQIDKRRIIHATARQRCEAFVTVMGKDTP